MTIYFITFATDINKCKLLTTSCSNNEIPLIILGLNENWKGFGMKYILINDYLQKNEAIKNDDLIIFNDGYDTLCQASIKKIENDIKKIYQKGKIIVSAEMYLWPSSIFGLKRYFDTLNQKEKYLYPCSGQYAGSKKDLIEMYQTINLSVKDDDQEAIIKYAYSFPDKIILDYSCILFQPNLFTLETEESHYQNKNKKFKKEMNDDLTFILDENQIKIKNLYTGNIPCFIHANGPPQEFLFDLFSKYISHIKQNLFYNQPFPPVYAIVMPDRKDYIQSIFHTHNIPYQMIDAINGKQFSYSKLYQDGIIPSPQINLTLGEIGCYLSHTNMISKLEDSMDDKIIIFEDDIRIPNYLTNKSIKEYILDALKKVPKDADILYLGRCYDTCGQSIPVNDMIVKVFNPLCLHAYVLFKKGIDKLKNILPIKDAIDRFYVNKINEGLIAYATNPPLFMQNNYLKSNVQRSPTNFTPICSENHLITHLNTGYIQEEIKIKQSNDLSLKVDGLIKKEEPEVICNKTKICKLIISTLSIILFLLIIVFTIKTIQDR
jgi:hypothetical protein